MESKKMKTVHILSLILLTGCVSQTVQKIESNPENIQKANEIQGIVQANLDSQIQNQKNSAEYKECVAKVKQLNTLKNKKSLSRADMESIFKMYPYGQYGWYYGWEPETLRCQLDYEYTNKELEKQISDFCYDKYWRGNWFTASTLFPLRMTNELLAIGTLGIFPTLTSSCSANGQGWTSEKSTSGFPVWCWKPGATWNYETCKKVVAGNNHSYYWNDKGYWEIKEPDNIDYTFSDSDIETLKDKMRTFCKTPTNLNPYANKLCKGDYTKGCLIDLADTYVSTFGTRRNGVLVSPRLFGLELKISENVFVYDNRDYYDGQELKTNGYYYQYVGNYNDGLQKIPSFRRSEYKIPKNNNEDVEHWCKAQDNK